jgi:hypothetical protein
MKVLARLGYAFVRMKVGPHIGCAVLVMVFGSAVLGMVRASEEAVWKPHLRPLVGSVLLLSLRFRYHFQGCRLQNRAKSTDH